MLASAVGDKEVQDLRTQSVVFPRASIKLGKVTADFLLSFTSYYRIALTGPV